MKTIAEVSKESLILEQFLQSCPQGQLITYQEIEEHTGIKMDNRGKGYLRTAIKRIKTEYSCVIGKGIELASPLNSSSIIAHRVIKIDNSVKKAEKTTKTITNNFYNDLPKDEQKQVNLLAALFGTIRSFSRPAKLMFKRTPPRLGE